MYSSLQITDAFTFYTEGINELNKSHVKDGFQLLTGL